MMRASTSDGTMEELEASLTECDGYCELGMWEYAWKVLEDLPAHPLAPLVVFTQRLRILVGRREWQDGFYLIEGQRGSLPARADIAFYAACICAGLNDMVSAKAAVAWCVALDPQWKSRIRDEPMLEPLWQQLQAE